MSKWKIIVFGEEWTGKSSVCKTILGKNRKTTTTGTESPRCLSGFVCERPVTVVDTPGWDPLTDTEETPLNILNDACRMAACDTSGPQAFLLVIPVSPNVEWNQLVSRRLKRLFGETIWRRTILLFTRGDNLSGGRTIQSHLQSEGKAFQGLLEICGNRCHAFNNVAEENGTQVAMLMKTIDDMVKQNDGQIFNFQDAWSLRQHQAKIQQLEALVKEMTSDVEDQELKNAEWPKTEELKEVQYVANKMLLSKCLETERLPDQPTFDNGHSNWNLSADFVQETPGYEIIPEARKDEAWVMLVMMVKIEVSSQSVGTLAQVTLLTAWMKQHGCRESHWEKKWFLVQGLILFKFEEAYGQSEGTVKVGVQAVEFQPAGAPEDNREGCCIQKNASQLAIKEANGMYPERENGDFSVQEDIELPGRREEHIKRQRRNSMVQDYNFNAEQNEADDQENCEPPGCDHGPYMHERGRSLDTSVIFRGEGEPLGALGKTPMDLHHP
ncbi:hypothetical protein UPYG_G00077140 [Umbra pygmaea]|uniref:AIG1-type G domain-containing protein n=1 Tax=Umbra pygmaea TaxID=75934 RepID=A0ABD0XSJ6_UMBPY